MRQREPGRARAPIPGGGEADNQLLRSLLAFGQQLGAIQQTVTAIHELLEQQAQPGWKEWYDTGELAEALGVSQHTVQARWCSGGRIECEKDADSGRWRIPGHEFRRLVNGGALRPRDK